MFPSSFFTWWLMQCGLWLKKLLQKQLLLGGLMFYLWPLSLLHIFQGEKQLSFSCYTKATIIGFSYLTWGWKFFFLFWHLNCQHFLCSWPLSTNEWYVNNIFPYDNFLSIAHESRSSKGKKKNHKNQTKPIQTKTKCKQQKSHKFFKTTLLLHYIRCISLKAVPLLDSRMSDFSRNPEHN